MVNSQLVQKESKLKTIAVDLLFDLIAGIAFGVSVNVFTAPNHIAPGGVTGFATLMNYIFGVPIGLMSFMINVPLLLSGVKILGKEFFVKTFKSVVIINFSVGVIVPDVYKRQVSDDHSGNHRGGQPLCAVWRRHGTGMYPNALRNCTGTRYYRW